MFAKYWNIPSSATPARIARQWLCRALRVGIFLMSSLVEDEQPLQQRRPGARQVQVPLRFRSSGEGNCVAAGGARGVVEAAVTAEVAVVLEESARLAAEIRQQLADTASEEEDEPALAPAPVVAPADATLTASQAQEHPWGCSKCRWWAGCKKCRSEELQLLLHKQDWRQVVMAGRARIPKGKK